MNRTGGGTLVPGVDSGTLVTSDREKISFQHFKNGCRDVIIVAHGFSNSKQCVILQRLARELGGEYDIFMFDFRGHGKSGGAFTWTSREGNDLRAVLDHIAPLYPRRGLIAFSMGASIGINVLAGDKRVDSFISVSAPSDIAKIDYRVWNIDWKGDAAYVLWDPAGKIGKGVRSGPFWLAKERPIDNVGKVACPIMFMHGSRDWVIMPWHSEALSQKAGGHKRTVVIRNGPHAEYLMRDHPAEFVEKVKEWFRETIGR
ncbi:MAG: alpha/beta fold hydrolase [Candidatus Omnitrophica bacterium]|nr:alpha/beta fold hydrolase [Candidatus Omnitrophota bacterium]